MKYIEKPQLDFNQLLTVYEAVGWTNYINEPDMLKNAYEHSLYTLVAYE
ncbi:hypothetical protein [Globicatella sanguinis]